MVNCLRDIGSKYEAFSILTPENVMSSITQHTECLVNHSVLILHYQNSCKNCFFIINFIG